MEPISVGAERVIAWLVGVQSLNMADEYPNTAQAGRIS